MRRPPHGFTLLELMVVCAVISILASVAIPSFVHMNDRAKAAERGVMVRSIRNALNSLRMKDGAFGPPDSSFAGGWNPVWSASPGKRPFSFGAANWSRLDLVIEGACYYSYAFDGEEAAVPFFTISVSGDADGDGVRYTAVHRYELDGGAFVYVDGPDPAYDEVTF